MRYILRFHRAVHEDVQEATRYYDHRQQGLGDYFLIRYFESLAEISRSAEVPRRFGIFRRVMVKKFPYAIWYRVDAQIATIVLVFDARRDPRLLRRILRSR